MASTAQFGLPLVMPAQAQKHVTVNEALARLDAVAQLRVVSTTVADPPAASADGESYLVPPAASGAWSGEVGTIAVRCNGGWIHLAPKSGWQVWDEAVGTRSWFDGVRWIGGATAVSQGGAATIGSVLEFDHVFSPGPTNLTSGTIPSSSLVLGVSGRVVDTITGAGVNGWRAGVPGSDNRYGSGLGTGVNSWLTGLSGSPVGYYADTPLLLTAEGGAFEGGVCRLAVHLLRIEPPRSV